MRSQPKTIRERVSKCGNKITPAAGGYVIVEMTVLKRKGRVFHHILSQGRLFPVLISSLSSKNIKNTLKNTMEISN